MQAELHHLLKSSVEDSLAASPKAGTFLSGGLDSSTVAGLAAGQRPGIHTISMGFDAAGLRRDGVRADRLAALRHHAA